MESKNESFLGSSSLVAKGPTVFGTIQKSIKHFEKQNIEIGMKLKSQDEKIKLVWNNVLQDRNSIDQLTKDLRKSTANYEIERTKRIEMRNKSDCTAAMFEAQFKFQTEICKSVEDSLEESKLCQRAEEQKFKELNDFKKHLEDVHKVHVKNINELPKKAEIEDKVGIGIIKNQIKGKSNIFLNLKKTFSDLLKQYEELEIRANHMEKICGSTELQTEKEKDENENFRKRKQIIDKDTAKDLEDKKNKIQNENSLKNESLLQVESMKNQFAELKTQREQQVEAKKEQEKSIYDLMEKNQAQAKKVENLNSEMSIKEQIKEMLTMKISDLEEVKKINLQLKQCKETIYSECEKLDSKLQENIQEFESSGKQKDVLTVSLEEIKKEREEINNKVQEIKENIKNIIENTDEKMESKTNAEKDYIEKIKGDLSLKVTNLEIDLDDLIKNKNKLSDELTEASAVPEELNSQCKPLTEKKSDLFKKIEALKEEKENICKNNESLLNEKNSKIQAINNMVKKAEFLNEGMKNLDNDLKELEHKMEELSMNFVEEKENLMKNQDAKKAKQEMELKMIRTAFDEIFANLENKMSQLQERLNKKKEVNAIWQNKIEKKENIVAENKKKMKLLEVAINSHKKALVKMRRASGVSWTDLRNVISLGSQEYND